MTSAFLCEECPRTLACIICATTFSFLRTGKGRWPRFCSDACRHSRQVAQAATYRSEGRYARPSYAAAYYAAKQGSTFTCAQCCASFVSKQIVAKYCSTACMALAISSLMVERHSKPKRTCEKCGVLFKPSRPNQQQRAKGQVQRRCSFACAGMTPRDTMSRRTRSDMLKANGGWKSVNPFVVFERDRWRCHLCGCSTPKRLRGTTDDRAPELDHVVPIAAGGEHSYENTACACRKCNRIKGCKPLGQPRLFA